MQLKKQPRTKLSAKRRGPEKPEFSQAFAAVHVCCVYHTPCPAMSESEINWKTFRPLRTKYDDREKTFFFNPIEFINTKLETKIVYEK